MAANLALKEQDFLSDPVHTLHRQSCSSPGFLDLVQTKKRVIAPLLLVSLGFFFCLTLLAGFAKPLMSTKLAGSFNIGFFLILLGYLVCWVAAVLYVRAANGIFDKKVAVILGAEHGGGDQS